MDKKKSNNSVQKSSADNRSNQKNPNNQASKGKK